MNTNNYTLDELYTRRKELEEMDVITNSLIDGWVGQEELQDLEDAYTAYDYEPGHWWSSLYHVEKAIEEREAMDRD